jgi:3-dehydroquinate synthase
VFSIKIKSKIHSYNVEEINNFYKKLDKVYIDNDIILIDHKVFNLYFKNQQNLNNYIIITSSEKNKEYLSISKIINHIIKKKFTKNNKIIAIGGGITQDIASFVSFILFRGVDWIFFPTTLLAQADSCIGGKVSINFKNFKNQLGFFNPPQSIFIDLFFLKTLSKKDIYSGIGEMMHYFLVSSKKDHNFYKNNIDEILKINKNKLKQTIFKTLIIKKKYIELDEFDKKIRLLLNYGHTFGHALESVSNYSIPHGIAVSHGMNISNYISYKYKYLNKNEFYIIENTIIKVANFAKPNNINIKKYKAALLKDKKTLNNTLRIILSKGPGKMFIKKQTYTKKFEEILKNYFKIYFGSQ